MEWFRSYHGAPFDAKHVTIAKRSETQPGVSCAIWWALLDFASQNEDRGSVQGFDCEVAADFFGWTLETVSRVVQVMGDVGLISDGRISNWDKRQVKREDRSTDRVRKFRESHQETGNALKRSETHGNARVDKSREETTPPLRARGGIWSDLPERFHDDLEHALKHVKVPDSLIATLSAMNSGLDPPPYTWEEIGLGLHDLVANGKHVQFNARQLRRYVAGAREQLQPKQQAAAPPADAAQAFEEALRFLRSIPGGYMHVTSEKLAEVPSNVQRAVRAAGGWKELANADEIGLRMRRKQFIEAFTASAA